MKLANFIISSGAVLSAALFFTIPVQAVFITGDIAINLRPGSSLSYDNTSVDFQDGSNSQVVAATGDYATLGLIGSVATYFDFSFAPLFDNNPGDGNPIVPGVYAWEIAADPGIHFILTSATGGVDADGNLSLAGPGRAYMNAQGKDITPGFWNFTADTTNGVTFNFSSTTSAKPPMPAKVPDTGTTVGALGASLLLVGVLRRRFSMGR